MPAGMKISDPTSTLELIKAFKTAVDEVESARSAVTTSQASLVGGWRGAAATKFDEGIGEWMRGLEQVKVALDKLDEGMTQFSTLTESSEDDRIAQAAAGAVSASWT